jgi:hypothetical protein
VRFRPAVTYRPFTPIEVTALLKTAAVGRNVRVLDANDEDTFLAAAKTRQWIREESVGMVAKYEGHGPFQCFAATLSIRVTTKLYLTVKKLP